MMKLTFTAYVYPEDVPTSPLVATPNKLRLDLGDDDRKHSVSFKNITMDTLQMELAWADEDFLSVEVPQRSIAPGERAEVLVGINASRQKARFESSLTIQTNDKNKTRITIPVVFGKDSALRPPIKNK